MNILTNYPEGSHKINREINVKKMCAIICIEK